MKKKLFVYGGTAALVLLTIGNSVGLVLAYRHYARGTGSSLAPEVQAAIKQDVPIKSAKQQDIDESSLGKPFQEGEYKFETLPQSKINDPKAPDRLGKLIIVNEDTSQAHYVLALAAQAKFDDSMLSAGWTEQTLSIDSMWQPGGCASKPTQLLNGRYIFVDDGKTKPEDKYSSYVFFDMQNQQYKYFGGDNFTQQQGDKEVIMKAVNENGQIVFYIDTLDNANSQDGNTNHTVGKDAGYIIRRVLDTETLHYVDYKLPFTIPKGVDTYTLGYNTDKSPFVMWGYSLQSTGVVRVFDGSLTGNKIDFKERPVSNTLPSEGDTDSAFDIKLESLLAAALPQFGKSQPTYPTLAKTKFYSSVLGSYNSFQFLVSYERFGDGYQTPAVYDSATNTVKVMTTKQIFTFGTYVPLGVY